MKTIVKNKDVISYWRSLIGGERKNEGKLIEIKNRSRSLRAYNDGTIYSYDCLIGEIKDGVHIVYDHTAPGGSFISHFTSVHVNAIKELAMKVVDYND